MESMNSIYFYYIYYCMEPKWKKSHSLLMSITPLFSYWTHLSSGALGPILSSS